MEKIHKCKTKKGLEIRYKSPNAIELYEIWGNCVKEGENGNQYLSKLLREFERYFISASDGSSYLELISDHRLMEDLSKIALDLQSRDLGEKEKK